MMTRKDYVQASEILSHYLTDSPLVVMEIAHDFAEYFALDNPRFNYDKFINAVSGDD